MCLALAGCGPIRDAVAWVVGAPTSGEINAQKQRLADAEDQVAQLDGRLATANRQFEAAEAQQAAAADRKAQLRSLYASMAQQMQALEGPAADALAEAIQTVQRQAALAEGSQRAASDVAARYRQQVAEIEGAQAAAAADIQAAEAALEGFATDTRQAISSSLGSLRAAGRAIGDLGVPGAAAATDAALGALRAGLETVLLGGALGGTALARRRRQQRDQERRRRLNLTRVVHAVEDWKLLKDDRELRQGAKQWAGPEAHRELKLALATDPTSGP